MRNLTSIAHVQADLSLPSEIGLVRFAAQDEENNVIYIGGSGLTIACINATSFEVLWDADVVALAASADCNLPPDAATLTAMLHSPDLDALTLAFSTGHLLLLHPPSPSSPQPSIEEIGVISGGIVAAEWSPDGEALALLSGAAQLLLMTPTWELLWETSVLNNSPSFPQPTATPGPLPEEGAAVNLSFGCAGINWRGDGRYLATCTCDIAGVQTDARLRVWDKETGELHSLGEGAPGLKSVFGWQPNGRHLYVAQHTGGGTDGGGGGGGGDAAHSERESGGNENSDSKSGGARGAQGQDPEVRHVGAWKRELRRREEAAKAAGTGTSLNHIILFERNGLQHGGFDVPTTTVSTTTAAAAVEVPSPQDEQVEQQKEEEEEDVIESLSWSPDSALLAVVLARSPPPQLQDTTTTTTTTTTTDSGAINSSSSSSSSSPVPPHRTVQLWHRSNWHWYLKHETRFADCSQLTVLWSTTANNNNNNAAGVGLKLFTAEGGVRDISFAWEPTVSSYGTAAVIDGATVLLTPFRECIVPPPMSATSVLCPAPVVAVALRQQSCGCPDEALAAVLSDGSLAVVDCVEEDLWEETLEEQLEEQLERRTITPPRILPRIVRLPPSLQGVVVRQVAWMGPSSVVLVASNPAGDDILVKVDVVGTTTRVVDGGVDVLEEDMVDVMPAPGPVVCCACCASASSSGAVIQIQGGQLFFYPSTTKGGQGGGLLALEADSFPTTCIRMLGTPLLPSENTNNFLPRILGLSAKGELWWNSRHIASTVTSFALRYQGPGGPFLMYTTRNHLLRTLPLASLLATDAAGSLQNNNNNTTTTAGGGGFSGPAGGTHSQEYQSPEIKLQQQKRRGANNKEEKDVTLRSIEEGSLLVACPADSVDVIYQAPRGNLETARPRALVIPAVAAALDVGDFALAWRLASVDRLDLNILADYKWPRFLDQAGAFVEALQSDVDVADFVAGLTPESVTGSGGLYAAVLVNNTATTIPATAGVPDSNSDPLLASLFLSLNGGGAPSSAVSAAAAAAADLNTPHIPQEEEPSFTQQEKIPAICEQLRKVVHRLETSSVGPTALWLRTEVTTYSKCGDLAAALKRIKHSKEAELETTTTTNSEAISSSSSGGGGGGGGGASAEQGLKHLLLYNLEEDVYNAALGSYELEMAYMVVTHSQRDPGEYLLQLQQFAAVENEALRCHAIDVHLGRFDGAVRHLMAAGDVEHFPQALQLAREHGLLRLLLQLTRDNHELRALVHLAAGEELEGRGKHEDAALAFVAAGDLEKALRAYRLAGQWRQALGLAARLGRDSEKILSLSTRLAADLADSMRYTEAAAVTLEYLNDISGAVALLCEGGEWTEALRVACCRGQMDLVESLIAPTAAAAASRILESVIEDTARVAKYWARLKELRRKRAAMLAAVVMADEDAGGAFGQRDDDVETEAASMVSGMSMYTDATYTAGGGGGSRVSTASATTVGGRKASKKRAKNKNKAGKIRQGTPDEEAQLARHLLSLAPLANVCLEVGQLTEVLVMLGHEEDAATLQQRLKSLIDAQKVAVDDMIANPPPGMSLVVSEAVFEKTAAAAGGGGCVVAVAALAAGAAEVAGGELLQKAAESEAAVKGSWKWEVLREWESSSTT